MSDIYRRSIVFILWQTNIDYEKNVGKQNKYHVKVVLSAFSKEKDPIVPALSVYPSVTLITIQIINFFFKKNC